MRLLVLVLMVLTFTSTVAAIDTIRTEALAAGYHDPLYASGIESAASAYGVIPFLGTLRLTSAAGSLDLSVVSHDNQPILRSNRGLLISTPGSPGENRPISGVTDEIHDPRIVISNPDYGSNVPTAEAVRQYVLEKVAGSPGTFAIFGDQSAHPLLDSRLTQDAAGITSSNGWLLLDGGPHPVASAPSGSARLTGDLCVGSSCIDTHQAAGMLAILGQICDEEDEFVIGYLENGQIQCAAVGDPLPTYIWYHDRDGDGYYNAAEDDPTPGTEPPGADWIRQNPDFDGDCHPTNEHVHPYAPPRTAPYTEYWGGDESFDYDCDGVERKRYRDNYVGTDNVCYQTATDCVFIDAFRNSGSYPYFNHNVPECGDGAFAHNSAPPKNNQAEESCQSCHAYISDPGYNPYYRFQVQSCS